MEKWIITDEVIARLSTPKSKIRIHKELYVIDKNQDNLIVGNVVLDRKDGCWGIIRMIMPSNLNSKNITLQAAVHSDGATELGVPLTRLIRLTKIIPESN